jgi:multisubunit Na+/H+ antiporter MnhG subunit
MDIYVIKLDEVMWGCLPVAITMAIHGTGMFGVLRITDSLKERYEPMESFLGGLGVVILASLMIILTNII